MTLPQEVSELVPHGAYRFTVALKPNYLNTNSKSTRSAGQLSCIACDSYAGNSQFKSCSVKHFYRKSCKFLSSTGGHTLDLAFLMSPEEHTVSFEYRYHIVSNKELSVGWFPVWAHITFSSIPTIVLEPSHTSFLLGPEALYPLLKSASGAIDYSSAYF